MDQDLESSFSVSLELPNGALVKVKGLRMETKVATMKTRIEQEAGVLPHTYTINYLDSAPLENHQTLFELDVVPGARLRVATWRLWHDTLVATLQGDQKQCLSELRALSEKGDAQWKANCSWCVLYTAAHRGYYELIHKLTSSSMVSLNAQSPCGWTALHAAAKMGRWKALCVLINSGADVRIRDK